MLDFSFELIFNTCKPQTLATVFNQEDPKLCQAMQRLRPRVADSAKVRF